MPSCSWSHDDERIVTACEDHQAIVFSTKTGNEIFTLKHDRSVKSCDYSKDGIRIITCTTYVGIIWCAETGTSQIYLRYDDPKFCLEHCIFSNDNKSIAVSSAHSIISLWDPSKCQVHKSLKAPSILRQNIVMSISFSHDDKHIIAGYIDQIIRVWDIQNGTIIRTICGHTSAILGSIFLYQTSFGALTISHDRTGKVWDVHNSLCLFEFRFSSDYASSCHYAPPPSQLS
mmetsp:Transcript_23/g.39  ORF Transcript_23/g.39 Transcript_23/m.39 type:complete len:230 (-) Transcript_23:153-842(-)